MADLTTVSAAGDALQSFGAPGSIAIVGASMPGGSYHGAKLMGNVIGAGTSARVYPVNPRYAGQEIMGKLAYGSLRELPEVPDLVVFATRTSVVSSSLREAAELGVRTCVVITSADPGEQEAFDAEVRKIAQDSGMRIVGPNSMGIINGPINLNASFASGLGGNIPKGPIAFLSQSGAVISAMLQRDQGTNIGYSWLISTGNEAATSIEQLFDDVIDDADVGVVVLFVEGVSSGRSFRRAALRAQLAGKPVVLLKAGVSESGRHAVQSHTGRMAGTREVFGAVAAESGIVAVSSFEEMFRAARVLRDYPPAARRSQRRRAAVLSNSGGLTTVTADHLDGNGWTLPEFTAAVQAAVDREAQKVGVNNPADVPGSWADNSRLGRVMSEIAQQEDIDAIFVVSGAGGDQARNVAGEVLKAIPGLRPEIYVAWIGATPEMRQDYEAGGHTLYDDPLDAVRAAETAARLRDAWARPETARALLAALDAAPADAPVEGTGERVWTAAETLASAADAGVAAVPTRVSSGLDAAEVAAIAAELGYPVALKIHAESLSHKTDVGGVRLGIASDAQVTQTVGEFARIAAAAGIADARVLVQKMVSGIEVLVGIKRDPAFGPVMFVGLGGIFAELQPELIGIPLPTVAAEVEHRLRGSALLSMLMSGYRGQPAGDWPALIEAVERIGRWAVSVGPALQEADFNPVMVSASGAVAVDGRAVVLDRP